MRNSAIRVFFSATAWHLVTDTVALLWTWYSDYERAENRTGNSCMAVLMSICQSVCFGTAIMLSPWNNFMFYRTGLQTGP